MSSNKKRRITTATRATFTAADPSFGTCVHVPVLNFPDPGIVTEKDVAQTANNRGAKSPDYPTVPKSNYAFQSKIWTGTKGFDGTGGDTDPTSYFLQSFWESYFGMSTAAVATPSTTIGVASGAGRTGDLVVASSAGITAGMAVMINGEVRWVTAVADATHLTLHADLSTSPANADKVYGAWNLSCVLGARTQYEDINVEKDGHSWQLKQGQIMSAKLSGFAAGMGMRVDMSYEGNDFSAGVTPTFTPNAFTGTPIITKSAQLTWDTVLTKVFTEAGVDFGLGKEWIPAATTATGRQGVEIVDQEKGQISLTTFYDATAWSRMQDLVNFPVMLAALGGSTNAAKARAGIAVFMPCAQVVPTAEHAVQNQVGNQTTLQACDPAESAVAAIATAGLAGTIKPMHLAIFGGN